MPPLQKGVRMKKKFLYIAWALLYCACVGLGFVSDPTGRESTLLTLISIGFFAPPYWLCYLAKQENDRKTLKILRLVSVCILALSLILIVLNIVSVNFSNQTGLVLYVLLVMFSAPMVCSQVWALSLFLWACLFFLSRQNRK